MSNNLSKKERDALNFIRDSLFQSNKSPSIRDIMRFLGYQSPNSAMIIVNKLIDRKIIKRVENGDLKITKDTEETIINAKTINVPLVGSVACGTPLLAEENIEMTIPVSLNLAKPPHRYFLLKAKGDSMNKAGINDGSLVLIRQQTTANNGDIVVALINDEATIKRFYKTKEAVILKPQSTNKKHSSIILTDNFKIQGVISKVLFNLDKNYLTQDE